MTQRRTILLLLSLLLGISSEHSPLVHAKVLVWSRQYGWILRRLDADNGTTSSSDNGSSDETKSCEPVSPCEICTAGERSQYAECQETGRRQRFDCVGQNATSETLYMSCIRTEAEEEFRMIRLQAFCFLIGVVSLVSVRKQKVVSASLFDQRKAAAAAASRGTAAIHVATKTPDASSSNSLDVEEIMDVELAPLTANPINVV